MAQNNSPPPPNSKGSYLGILDKSTEEGKHMGIGAISITNPVAARVSTTQEFTLQVEEISQFKLMMIARKRSSKLLLHAGNPLMIFLNQSIDMSTWVLNSVCIGFTSATGPFLESHEVLNCTF